MKLSEFIVLDNAEKKRSVMQDAVPLAKRNCGDTVIFLFQMEDYYIEAYCSAVSREIEEYRVLPGVEAIGEYLDAISIDGLID